MAAAQFPCPSHPTNSLEQVDTEMCSQSRTEWPFVFKRSSHIYQQKPWAEVGANCRELLAQGLLEDFNMATCGFILKLGGWRRSGAAKRSNQLGKMCLHMVTCTNSAQLASN